MLVSFEEMPDEARIWIYPCNRKFSESEENIIKEKLSQFVENWAAHGTPLKASFQIPYSRFIVIAVDETNQEVSGCSIDACVGMIQEIEEELKVDLLDRLNVTFKLGEYFTHKPLIDFKKLVKDKAVSENTIVFNNLVNTVGEWREFWEVPAIESWHKRFF
jgi:hypothetical protein